MRRKLTTLVIGFLLTISVVGLAKTVVEVDEVIEGTVDGCENKLDVFNYKFGVYYANVKNLEVEGDNITFDTELKFAICKMTADGKFKRFLDNPLREISYTLPKVDSEDVRVTVIPQSLTLKYIKDGVYKVFESISLGSKESKQNVETTLPLSQILTDDERDRLDRDGAVRTHFTYFIEKDMLWTSSILPDSKERMNWSAHRTILEIKKIDNGLTAKVIKTVLK